MAKSLIKMLLICFILVFASGCMAGITEVTVNPDNSIEIFVQAGVSENTVKAMASSSQEVNELANQASFTYRGITYYGEIDTKKVNNAEEFNNLINEVNEYGTDQGAFNLTKKEDGSYLLKLIVTNDTADTTQMEADMEINGLSDAQIDRLMNDMVMLYTFNMPAPVTQVSGSKAGITISGNKIVIDYLKLDLPKQSGEKAEYTFSTQVQTSSALRFSDVPTSLWSYKAINTLAEGGLVAGVGGGRFSPERGMKISEFCQVLANAMGLESGADESGYWAAKAIKSCIEKGYIYTHGEINPQIYDEVITREEAIAAMQLASGRPQIAGKNITIDNIPDGEQISDKYKSLVLQAYNSGITAGVNDQLKFSPQNKLTRGQVCQLFYNVNWTTKNNE